MDCSLVGPLLRLPCWLSVKESACKFRSCRFDLWVEKIPWRRESLGNLMDRGARQAAVHRAAHSLVTKQQTAGPGQVASMQPVCLQSHGRTPFPHIAGMVGSIHCR